MSFVVVVTLFALLLIKIRKIQTKKIKVMPPELSGAKSARAAETVRPKTFFVLQGLKDILPDVIVQGIPSVNRAVINVQEPDSSRPAKEERYCGRISGETMCAQLFPLEI